MLSYLGILWLVPLLAAKDSPYAKFHCNQGILLTIVWFGATFIVAFINIVAGFIPLLGFCIGCVTTSVVILALLALMVMGIVNALNGKMKPLPMFPPVSWVK